MQRKHFNKHKIYFLGCTHFGHNNVLKYDKRPFDNIIEHDNTLISNINNIVKDTDIIYFLGDFCFIREFEVIEKILKNINGIKYLIYGNHDQIIEENTIIQNLFEECNYYEEIMVDKQLVILSHYPMNTWAKSNYGSWMLHSHIHGNKNSYYPENMKILDVGIMNNNYIPFSYFDIETKMNLKKNETFS